MFLNICFKIDVGSGLSVLGIDNTIAVEIGHLQIDAVDHFKIVVGDNDYVIGIHNTVAVSIAHQQGGCIGDNLERA